MDNDKSITLMDAWQKFRILDCVKHVGLSTHKQSTINACWKAIWPAVVDSGNDKLLIEHEYSEITELAQTIEGEGFEDLAQTVKKITADEELNEDDLSNMIRETQIF